MSSSVLSQVHSKSTGKEGEAEGPAAGTPEDPIEGSPAPLQQQQQGAAAQETSSPPRQGQARQRKQLKPLYTSKSPHEGAWAVEISLIENVGLACRGSALGLLDWAKERSCCMAMLLKLTWLFHSSFLILIWACLAEDAGPPEKLRRLVRKAAEAMIGGPSCELARVQTASIQGRLYLHLPIPVVKQSVENLHSHASTLPRSGGCCPG